MTDMNQNYPKGTKRGSIRDRSGGDIRNLRLVQVLFHFPCLFRHTWLGTKLIAPIMAQHYGILSQD